MMILIMQHPIESDQNQHLNMWIKPNQRQRRFSKISFPSKQNEKVTSNCYKANNCEGNKEMSVERREETREREREKETMEKEVIRHAGPVKHMLDPLNSINRRNTLFHIHSSFQRTIMVVY